MRNAHLKITTTLGKYFAPRVGSHRRRCGIEYASSLLAKSENAVVKYTMVNRGRDIERYFATKRERQFRKRGRNKLFMRKTHARATLLLIDIIQLAYIGRDIYRE